MRNLFSCKRMVFICTILHTSVIVMLLLLAMHSGALSKKPLLTMLFVAFSVVLTFYTTRLILQSVNDEIGRRAKGLARISADLQTMSAEMAKYAKELERRTIIIRECGRELEHRANIVNQCSDKMNLLIAAAELTGGGFGQAPDGAVTRKSS